MYIISGFLMESVRRVSYSHCTRMRIHVAAL